MAALDLVLEVALRAFGLFWLVGGVFAVRKGQQVGLIDTALEALTMEREDRTVGRFIFVGGLLTAICGAVLLVAPDLALPPLLALVLSQVVYFIVQARRLRRARDEEERDDATVQPSTWNAFRVSVLVTAVVLVETVGPWLR